MQTSLIELSVHQRHLALEEIAANAGKYYDAEVARTCIDLFREKAFAFKA